MAFEWLNENSKKFLQGGYLKDGITAEVRIKEIANHAEKILGIKGYSDKFYDYMSKGYYSLSSPVWSNFGTNKGLSISCVTGDTWINTSNGGKMAKDIELGDLVLTHKNRFRKVVNVIPTKDKNDIWKLKVGTRMTNLYITGDHVVLTNTGWKRVDELDMDKDLIAVNGELEYEYQDFTFDMKKYTNYEFIIEDGLIKKAVENTDKTRALRNNKEKTHITTHAQIPEYINVDEDLAWAIGLWFADGSLSTNGKSEANGIRLTGNIKDKDGIVKKWSEIIESKFNINTGDYISEVERNGKENEWVTVNANSKLVGDLFESFGKGAKNKLIPEELLKLPKQHLAKLLEGLLSGDGSFRNDGNTVKLTLANPKLILQVYNIGLKLGKSMSLQMQEKAGKLSTTSHVYTLLFRDYVNSVSKNNVRSGIPFSDGLTYAPIHTLEKTNKVEDVYDFTVEEDHSFSCAGVVVHNCFGSSINDTMANILYTHGEVGMMSKFGGGTSGYFGNLRHRGAPISDNGESSGAVHFMEMFDKLVDVASQGNVRRGAFSPYLPIEHPDIEEFLHIGSEGNPIQKLTHGVTVTDKWMKEMIDGDAQKRSIWAKVIQSRVEIGYPYIFFTDTVNNNTVDVYKDKGLKINHSNLCSEIALPNNNNWSFVCCLSSMNLLHFDEWKATDAVETMIYFLDAVITEFCSDLEAMRDSDEVEKQEAFTYMKRAYNFAKDHRALGLGTLGYHSYLQSKMIPFESVEASQLNVRIARFIQKKSLKATKDLAVLFGEPELLKGYGRRNTTTQAIAPTTSSAFILGQVSQSIEPIWSNIYVKDVAKAKVTIRNPYLKKVLETYGKDDRETWNSIRGNDGSVQHLTFLSDHEKEVFKTFSEIDQYVVLDQAALRQQFIDQSQSLNIMVNPKMSAKEINNLYIFAWKNKIKTLYYQHSTNAAQQFSKDKTCVVCEA